VSSVSDAGSQSSKRVIALVLAIIGILFLILGVVYLVVPAHSLPGFIGYIKNGGTGKHNLRMATSFVIGVVLLVAAWFVGRSNKSAAGARA
jgi:hypothetical protein